MKIAYIANSRFPSEKAQSDQVMAMCSAFAALGHTVKLFVPERKPIMADDPFAYYGKSKTFEFERVPCIDALRFVPWLGAVAQWIQTVTFLGGLRTRLAAFAPDVVYSREPYVFAWGRLPGLRVWESHTLHRSAAAQAFLKRLDVVVALTSPLKAQIASQGVPPDHIVVEPDAVDPALFASMPDRAEARARLGVHPDEFLFLYTGKFLTMNMPKGLDESIEAVRRLRAERKNARLIAVGGSPNDLARYGSKAGESITIMGHRPQGELKEFYAAADALLMPFPYTEHYAFYMSPLKLFEYLMAGKPIVATDLPSVRDIVDERSAFIATPGSIDSITREMRSIMDDPEEARRRATVAHSLAPTYAWAERAKRISQFLEKFRSL